MKIARANRRGHDRQTSTAGLDMVRKHLPQSLHVSRADHDERHSECSRQLPPHSHDGPGRALGDDSAIQRDRPDPGGRLFG